MDEQQDEPGTEKANEQRDDQVEEQEKEPAAATKAMDAAADGLRALALRLLWPRHPYEPRPAGEPELLVGQLPPALPVAVPLPPGSQVVGSLVGQDSATIVLDCDLGPAAVLDFYRGQLHAQGWTDPAMRAMQRGFVYDAGMPQGYLQFCQGNRGLNVTVHEAPGHPSDVRLQLDTYDNPRHSPCAAPDPRHAMHDRMWALVPSLTPPPGASQRPEGGSGGQDIVSTSARLTTNLDLDAVTAHYAAQLTRANWTRDDEGASGPVGWSAWSLTDDEGQRWHGLFLALRQPHTPNEYFLLVRVARDEGEPGGKGGTRVVGGITVGGWSSSVGMLSGPAQPR